jgi:hypothetical protein
MSVRRVFALIFSLMGLIMLAICLCLFLLFRSSSDLKAAQDGRYKSYLLADELRQSSDDLTTARASQSWPRRCGSLRSPPRAPRAHPCDARLSPT